jgi:putative phage-type endonuclease
MISHSSQARTHNIRRDFIGGSDARIIMGQDEKALIRLWQEKRGEVGPEDLSANLIVQLGVVTEDLNRVWYERNTGRAVTAVQSRVKHPVIPWMAATLDGMVTETGAVYEAKFMLPWSFSEGAAAEKHMAQLQHNMWVTNAKTAALSIITGGGKWIEIAIAADPLYQHLLLTAEKKFWRCVQSGDQPHLFGVVPPRPRIEEVRVDGSAGGAYLRNRLRHSLLTSARTCRFAYASQTEPVGRRVFTRHAKSELALVVVPTCSRHSRIAPRECIGQGISAYGVPMIERQIGVWWV